MGLGRVITERIRRSMRGAEEDDGLVAAWRELAPPARDAGELTAAAAKAVGELEAELAALRDAAPDAALRRRLTASLRQVAVAVARLRHRCDTQVDSGRGAQRQLQEAKLRLAHLEDEVARCRSAIDHECRRRGLKNTRAGEDGLHDELVHLFRAISNASSRRMQAVIADPVLTELERLLGDADDPAAIDRVPSWLQQPARRLMELVRERQRYRRMLSERGLLP